MIQSVCYIIKLCKLICNLTTECRITISSYKCSPLKFFNYYITISCHQHALQRCEFPGQRSTNSLNRLYIQLIQDIHYFAYTKFTFLQALAHPFQAHQWLVADYQLQVKHTGNIRYCIIINSSFSFTVLFLKLSYSDQPLKAVCQFLIFSLLFPELF